MARAGRRVRQRARASAARRLTQQRAEQQRDRRERVERARRRRQELIRRHGPLGPVLQRLDDDSDSASSSSHSSSDESSDDESRVDEQALSPKEIFYEYLMRERYRDAIKFVKRTPDGLALLGITTNPPLVALDDDMGRTLLHHAAALDDLTIASMLLRYGANPSLKDDDDQTPLHCAAETSSYRTLACLLDNGAEVDAQDDMGATPLMLAAEENSRECCVALIAAGANVHYKDEDEASALFYAATEHKHPRCIVPLLDAGAEASVDILRRTVQDGSPRGLHPLLRVPPATDANFNMRRFLDSRELLFDVDGLRLRGHDRKAMRVNLAYLERVVAAGGIVLHERGERRKLVSLLRRHVAPRAPDDVLHVIVSFWGHPGSY